MTYNSLTSAHYPASRPRRLRRAPWLRGLITENRLHVNDLIWPVFVRAPESPAEITSMPGVRRYTLSEIAAAVAEAHALGIQAIALFPYVEAHLKSEDAREATQENNLICQTIRILKEKVPSVGVLVDVALDPYTTHGHDGIVVNGDVDNDRTVETLVKQALVQAQAGADVVAPSDMMDGRIGVIRQALDQAGFFHVAILAYSAKYASAFYGPFREAVGSLTNLGKSNKRSYQMSPTNSAEALREVFQDIQEAADIVMVKPALPYLDVIHAVRQHVAQPVFAYHVSGEYAMIKAAELNGWMDGPRSMWESVLSIKRAGAQAILTYAARDIATWLQDGTIDSYV